MKSKSAELFPRLYSIYTLQLGKLILRLNGINETITLNALGNNDNRKNNLLAALAEELIPIEILKQFLNKKSPDDDNQLLAMLTDQGLKYLRSGELGPLDFNNKFVDPALSPEEQLTQIYHLKKIEKNFFQESSQSLDSKKTTIDYYCPKPEKLDKNGLSLPVKETPEVSSSGMLPEDDIAWKAIEYARKNRKKGYSELENNQRGVIEYKFIISSLDSVRENASNVRYKKILPWLSQHGFLTCDNYTRISKAAYMHAMIQSVKSTYLANCDEMALLALHYLYENGYKNPAQIAQIDGHSFLIVMLDNGKKQIWDPWSNKAYWFANREIFLQNWEPGVSTTTGGAAHQLVPFNPKRHKIRYVEFFTLENLRSFYHMVSKAHAQEQYSKPLPGLSTLPPIQNTNPVIIPKKEESTSIQQAQLDSKKNNINLKKSCEEPVQASLLAAGPATFFSKESGKDEIIATTSNPFTPSNPS